MNPNRTVAFAPHETFDKALRPSLPFPILHPSLTHHRQLHSLSLTPFRLFCSDPNTIVATLQLLAAAIPTAPKKLPAQNERNQAAPPAPTAYDPLLGQAHHSFKSVALPSSFHLSLC